MEVWGSVKYRPVADFHEFCISLLIELQVLWLGVSLGLSICQIDGHGSVQLLELSCGNFGEGLCCLAASHSTPIAGEIFETLNI